MENIIKYSTSLLYSSYLIIDDKEFSNFGKKEESLESLIENLKASLMENLK